MQKFLSVQEKVILEYRIDLCDGTKCKNDWRRTHAHVKERKICKWIQKNSFASTFTLLHEIGHIETTRSWMRRCESEFYATMWAIDKCKEFGLKIDPKIVEQYQAYIDMEKNRGIRRGGNIRQRLILSM